MATIFSAIILIGCTIYHSSALNTVCSNEGGTSQVLEMSEDVDLVYNAIDKIGGFGPGDQEAVYEFIDVATTPSPSVVYVSEAAEEALFPSGSPVTRSLDAFVVQSCIKLLDSTQITSFTLRFKYATSGVKISEPGDISFYIQSPYGYDDDACYLDTTSPTGGVSYYYSDDQPSTDSISYSSDYVFDPAVDTDLSSFSPEIELNFPFTNPDRLLNRNEWRYFFILRIGSRVSKFYIDLDSFEFIVNYQGGSGINLCNEDSDAEPTQSGVCDTTLGALCGIPDEIETMKNDINAEMESMKSDITALKALWREVQVNYDDLDIPAAKALFDDFEDPFLAKYKDESKYFGLSIVEIILLSMNLLTIFIGFIIYIYSKNKSTKYAKINYSDTENETQSS